MASRKNFKKAIASVMITRVSHTDGKDNRALVRKYYKELRADLEKEVEAVMAEIGELSKTKEA